LNNPVCAQTLQEMQTYYRERAREYDEWFYRQGRYNYGPETNARWFAEVDEVFAALEAFHLTGKVLELASGTGIWTERLVRTASTITAVDASPEMIEINRARVGSRHVSYLQADLFDWQPEHTYDAIFFGFWISHVPLERLDAFLGSAVAMLHSGGRVFFVDTRRETTSTAVNQHMPMQDSQTMTRRLNDGRAFEIVKNFYDPADLAARCTRVGLDITICQTTTYFLYGYGVRQ
jgi:2-polyprenyl-3-methyl-5-hydroxy-6-metoxy-1,4-benzoquinol methylase